jgi:erythritol transport system ATP-binding protein
MSDATAASALPATGAVLRAIGIRKVFPGTVALDGVDFEVHEGKVNVLVGENGAGKSTLMKILAGIEPPTSGQLELDGSPLVLHGPRDAMAKGIGIVHQELNLFPNLSVAENIFVGHELGTYLGGVRFGDQDRAAREALARLHQEIDVHTLVQDLSIGKQQIVEIAKVLSQDVRVLILDEPTSSLSEAEVETLFSLLHELKRQRVSIVYISHRLEEVLEIGDTFTVLRDGRLVARKDDRDVNLSWIVERMVGQLVDEEFPKSPHDPGDDVLVVEDLTVPRPFGGYLLQGVSLRARAGEVIGLYGLMGAGRTELFETLVGLRKPSGGAISLAGRALAAGDTVSERLSLGLALVPENRQLQGLVQDRSVGDNVVLASLRRYASLGWLGGPAMHRDIRKAIADLSIKVPSPDTLVSALSGGNQQKVVFAKNLLTEPRVLLLDEPTRGIDVKAKREIFEIVDRLAGEGYAVLFASSELKEIMGAADRVLVFAQGRITADLPRGDVTEEKLVQASQVHRAGQREVA